MESAKSLRSTINRSMIVLTLLSVSMVGSLWIIQEYVRMSDEILKQKNNYIAARKAEIKTEVDRVIAFIDYKRTSTELQLKESIKTRVNEANAIANGIYNSYHGEKSDKEIQKIIKEALRPLIFNDGRGYYFIYDMQGNNVLLPFSPHLEGQNLWNLKDSKGNYTIQQTAQIIREKGEGFQRWHWYKPDETTHMSEKIGFSKHFKPYDWWIGTGEYIEDFERDIQKETLERIDKIQFGNDGYIFVYNFDGTVLAHFLKDTIGSNVLQDTTDQYGIKIVGDLIRNSQQEDGGFLDYVGKIRPSTGLRAQKIGYSQSVQDWQWTVGAGVYVDDINDAIEIQRTNLVKRLTRDVLNIIIIFIFSLISIWFILKYISKKTTDHLAVFEHFFEKASTQSIKIDDNDVHFSEFKLLALSANQMIDDRIRTEQELTTLRIYLSNIIDSMPSLLAGVDNKHKITQWNKQAEKLSGVSFANAKGKNIDELLPRLSKSQAKINQAISQRQVQHERNYLVDEGNTSRYEDITIFPLIRNGVEGAVIRIDDVTQQHEMQMELSHSRRLDAIGQLAGGVAHDFNNMLAGILGGAELLKLHVEGDEKAQKYLEMIIQSGQRAGDLTSKLLTFARKGKIESTPVAVAEALNEAVTILQHSLDKRVNITLDVQAGNTLVIGDLSQLQNALINLGVNAGHAMPNGGNLHFKVQEISLDTVYCEISPFEIEAGDYLKIEVSDTGEGIPLKNIHNIFEPFFTTRKMGKGSGLGLAAVYGTVQQHHGAINVYSQEGVGTTFHIFLPLTDQQEKTSSERETVHITGSGTILVIDDEEVLRATAAAILDNLGYEVLLAEDGKHGLEIFKQQYESIDFVIIDMIMPKMNGKDCFSAIRKISPDVKVILTSGFSQDADINELRKDGLRGFLRKPYTTTELSKAIAAASNVT